MPLSAGTAHAASPPLCWLHGFTQTGRSAHVFRSILAAGREVLAPDLLGHGTNAATTGTLDEMARAVLDVAPPTPFDLGGYSLGGRVALHVALAAPARVRRLVLLGATRGLPSEDERVARQARDEELAERLERDGAESFLATWLSQPMFADLPVDDVERGARSTDAAGLAGALRLAGTGTQRWLGDDVATLAIPTLVLAGAADERFAREAQSLAATMPRARWSLVPGAGHAAHLHQPALTAALVEDFLDRSVGDDAAHDQGDAEE